MNSYGRMVQYVNAEGEADFLFTVASMLDLVIDAIVQRGATNITVSVL
jgi:hypothetical protein